MNKIKLFVDDYRDPHSAEYFVCTSTNDTIATIEILMNRGIEIEVLDLDYDAGCYKQDGGDYINILHWMAENDINNIPIHLHSSDKMCVELMRKVIKENGWKEV